MPEPQDERLGTVVCRSHLTGDSVNGMPSARIEVLEADPLISISPDVLLHHHPDVLEVLGDGDTLVIHDTWNGCTFTYRYTDSWDLTTRAPIYRREDTP